MGERIFLNLTFSIRIFSSKSKDKDGEVAEAAAVVEVKVGVNGTSCGLYPACVAVGIKDGLKKVGGFFLGFLEKGMVGFRLGYGL